MILWMSSCLFAVSAGGRGVLTGVPAENLIRAGLADAMG
jgi:hypothetical protein